MKRYAIIVAGGKGIRMQSDVPKQFLPIAGQPVLMWTLQAFHKASPDIFIILVLPSDQIETWKSLVKEYKFNIKHSVVIGGPTRFHSVQNGLSKVSKESLVAIHDGVRPLISKKIIDRSFEEASVHGNAITSVKLKESIREIDTESNRAVDREGYRSIQTPQTFKSSIILNAFNEVDITEFTDDAGVLESCGEKIHLIEGEYSNIKITTKEDLVFAEAILSN